MNRFKLLVSAVLRFSLGFVAIGALAFGAAGTLAYPNGWLFIGALIVPMLILCAVLLLRDPAALERRLASREPDKAQRWVIALSAVMFIGLFVIAGLDWRFGWSHMPLWVSWIAAAIMVGGYALFATVILQNSYASRVVDVFENQKLITNGLYGLVRHPMYTATLLLFLSMPIILGSWYALIPIFAYPLVLVRRIANEEELLGNELEGYAVYTQKTRYRLFPGIW